MAVKRVRTSRSGAVLGRAEQGLNKSLRKRMDVSEADAAALRVLARALDGAEHNRDWRGVAMIAKSYGETLARAGLTGPSELDPFAAFVAGLSGAGTGPPAEVGKWD